MPLADPILDALDAFRPEFSRPTWDKAIALIPGTIPARGRPS